MLPAQRRGCETSTVRRLAPGVRVPETGDHQGTPDKEHAANLASTTSTLVYAER